MKEIAIIMRIWYHIYSLLSQSCTAHEFLVTRYPAAAPEAQLYPKLFAGKTDIASTLEKFESKIEKAIEAANLAYEENN